MGLAQSNHSQPPEPTGVVFWDWKHLAGSALPERGKHAVRFVFINPAACLEADLCKGGLQNIFPLEVVMSMLGTVQSKLAAGANSRASISAAEELSPAGAEGFEDHCWA